MVFLALASATLHIMIAVFQVMLASGKPWGIYAFGGQHQGVLPRRLRIASVFSCFLLLAFAAVNLQQAGFVSVVAQSHLRAVSWVIAGYAVLGTFMNAISRSRAERLLWTPVCLVLAVLNMRLLFIMPAL